MQRKIKAVGDKLNHTFGKDLSDQLLYIINDVMNKNIGPNTKLLRCSLREKTKSISR